MSQSGHAISAARIRHFQIHAHATFVSVKKMTDMLSPTDAISYAFFPDGKRARLLDMRMRLQLAESLGYLHDVIAAQWSEENSDLRSLVENMRRGAVYPPSTFGLYYEISSALLAGQRNKALSLFGELLSERPLSDQRIKILMLDDQPQENVGRYQRLMDTDPNQPFLIRSASQESATAFCTRFDNAHQRMRMVIPSLADEFESLIRHIVLVGADEKSETSFVGGSCYMLWGALFLNADTHCDDVAIIQAIAHEGAHSLLFSFTIDQPLVFNNADELYSSPLRDDPRPVDGIFHATYVSARMHWAMSALLESGTLDAQEIAKAEAARLADLNSFQAGYETIAKHGKLSDVGKAILAGANDYIAQTRSREPQL